MNTSFKFTLPDGGEYTVTKFPGRILEQESKTVTETHAGVGYVVGNTVHTRLSTTQHDELSAWVKWNSDGKEELLGLDAIAPFPMRVGHDVSMLYVFPGGRLVEARNETTGSTKANSAVHPLFDLVVKQKPVKHKAATVQWLFFLGLLIAGVVMFFAHQDYAKTVSRQAYLYMPTNCPDESAQYKYLPRAEAKRAVDKVQRERAQCQMKARALYSSPEQVASRAVAKLDWDSAKRLSQGTEIGYLLSFVMAGVFFFAIFFRFVGQRYGFQKQMREEFFAGLARARVTL